MSEATLGFHERLFPKIPVLAGATMASKWMIDHFFSGLQSRQSVVASTVRQHPPQFVLLFL